MTDPNRNNTTITGPDVHKTVSIFKKWHKNLDWVTALFLVITPVVCLFWLPLRIESELSWISISGVLLFLVYTYICGMSITGGYHRLFSHRSYEAKTWVRCLYLLFGAGAFQGSALKWCTDHRIHHRHVDTETDPYSINKGFWFAHIGWLFKKAPPDWRMSIPVDLAKDRLVVWQDRYYFVISTLMGFGLPTLVGFLFGDPFGGLLFGGFLRVVVTHHCTFLINSLCHMWGFRPYNVTATARDNFVLAFFTFGEGYHNFHHHFQADYRNGIRWYHWDPTKWLVKTLSWTGGASRLKVACPAEILKAQLAADEKRLVMRGVSGEKIQHLRSRVEEAQTKFRKMLLEYKTEYRSIKSNAQKTSSSYLIQKKADLKVARLEFKGALRQWTAYTRIMRSMPV